MKLDKDQYSKSEVEELVRKETDSLTEKVDIANLVAEMTDSEKTYYKGLEGEAKQEFLFMDSDERDRMVEKSIADDPVVYTADDGSEFRKSDDPRLIKMAKDNDKSRKELKKANDLRESDRLAKRAETELEYFPGTIETRVEILKAVGKIEDDKVRTECEDALKAQNAKMSKAFDTIGAGGQPTIEVGSAEQEMDELTKAYQREHPEVGYYDAYDLVAKANPDTYSKAVNNQ